MLCIKNYFIKDIHFQYNGFLFGLMVISMLYIQEVYSKIFIFLTK